MVHILVCRLLDASESAASYPRAARSAERLILQLKIAMVGALVRLAYYYIVIFYLCLSLGGRARVPTGPGQPGVASPIDPETRRLF
jgi:hypothetical protein